MSAAACRDYHDVALYYLLVLVLVLVLFVLREASLSLSSFLISMSMHALTLATISDWATTFTLIFGGCCRFVCPPHHITRSLALMYYALPQ